MATPDSAPPESLSGDFMLISIVTEYNTTNETEQAIGETMGEVTKTNESEAAETTYHESAVTQQKRKHLTQSFEFILAAIPDQPQLQTIGTHDSEGNRVNGNGTATHEAMRIRIFNNEPDGMSNYDDAWEFRDCELAVGEVTYSPGDPGEVPISVFVNGGIRHGITSPPS